MSNARLRGRGTPMKPLATLMFIAASLPCAAWATDPPAPPAEIKKTVGALAGKWTAAAIMTMPGAKEPVKFVEKFDCKKVAAGRGVECSDVAKVPGMGTMDFTHLVSYDAER